MSNFLNNSTVNGAVNINICDKRSRSPSAESSVSSVSSCEVKRSRKLDYLAGNGQKEWEPKDKLILNGIDITAALIKFRNNSIKAAEKKNDLNSLRILSLSHVFLVNKLEPKNCVTSYLEDKEAKELSNWSHSLIYDIPRASSDAVLYCKAIADGNEVEGYKCEDSNTLSESIKDLAEQLINNKAKINQASEASFMDKHLMPEIRRVLLNNASDDIVYAMIDGMDTNKKKPDFMLGFSKKRKDIYCFFVEVKRPKQKSSYQEEDDMTKLLKQLKFSIDKQLLLGLRDPVSLGLLVEGFKCSLYKMTLVADGIYLPWLVKRFSLVEEIHQMVLLPSIVESLTFVKNELVATKERLDEKKLRSEKKTAKERIRPSFITKFQ
ncbi:hypothetical protein BCV72DRAFT_339521 [Rhizopus microsporus var. microsporus]|uniref:Uncharacterized protein n=2 Tax=Rhizopus microsporus TaxID=58291 RepID=A0A2G4SH14_RHIZD|nr:uncharacterized protein RHIMIDRAFT_270482 [Rhizopus microsporus ATCC 52813]ORE01295.1 hypothetical protein BCV72DRAFT_339521 [Rhizopus microsporus var. microsporus]PHZ08067.1 hypothetical protein RHIMIDRAFT_270482 [Rhizopus microsporus ATCC 52813]